MDAIPTLDAIELMTSAQLVAAFNEIGPAVGQRPVKKFETRQTGIKRLAAAADALRKSIANGSAPSATDDVVESSSIDAAPEDPGDVGGTGAPGSTGETDVDVAPEDPADPVAEAASAIRSGTKVKDALATRAPKPKKPVAEKPLRGGSLIGSRVVELTGDGYTRAEVWDAIRKEFDLHESREWYVEWFLDPERAP